MNSFSNMHHVGLFATEENEDIVDLSRTWDAEYVDACFERLTQMILRRGGARAGRRVHNGGAGAGQPVFQRHGNSAPTARTAWLATPSSITNHGGVAAAGESSRSSFDVSGSEYEDFTVDGDTLADTASLLSAFPRINENLTADDLENSVRDLMRKLQDDGGHLTSVGRQIYVVRHGHGGVSANQGKSTLCDAAGGALRASSMRGIVIDSIQGVRKIISCTGKPLMTNVKKDSGKRQTSTTSSDGGPSELPIGVQVGIKLFFRLLQIAKLDQNPRTLSRVVSQLPLVLQSMPPLALKKSVDDIGNVKKQNSYIVGAYSSQGEFLGTKTIRNSNDSDNRMVIGVQDSNEYSGSGESKEGLELADVDSATTSGSTYAEKTDISASDPGTMATKSDDPDEISISASNRSRLSVGRNIGMGKNDLAKQSMNVSLYAASNDSRPRQSRQNLKQKNVVEALSSSLKKAITTAITQSKSGDSAAQDRHMLLRGRLSSNTSQHHIPIQDTMLALSSLVGLAIKQGSLTQILQSIILVMKASDTIASATPGTTKAPTSHASGMKQNLSLAVRPYLLELEASEPVSVESPMQMRKNVGVLMTFGKGDHGKLGHGNSTDNKRMPTFVASLKNTPLMCIDSLSTHSVAISVDGTLYTWGNGDKHRLGHGSTSKEYVPRVVRALSDKAPVISVACGLGHTMALLVTGQIFSWGNGSNGRLGLGDTQDRSVACLVAALKDTIVTEVFSGASHSLCVSNKGVCFSWGKNNQGQCGHGSTADILVPTSVLTLSNPSCPTIRVAGGWEHTLALDAQGRLFSFGSGYKDSRRNGLPPVLGHGSHDRETQPRQVLALKDKVVVHVACGWDHSLAVTDHGMLYSWGAGTNGKLGHGDELDRSVPSQVLALSHVFIVQAEAGCEHSVAISLEGQLFTWGHGDSGRLGHGDDKTQMIPKVVSFNSADGCDTDTCVVSVAVGDKYNLVLVSQEKEDSEESNSGSNTLLEDLSQRRNSTVSKKDENRSKNSARIDGGKGIISASNEVLMSPEWILSLQRFSLRDEECSQTSNVPVIIATHLARLVDPILNDVKEEGPLSDSRQGKAPHGQRQGQQARFDTKMFSPFQDSRMENQRDVSTENLDRGSKFGGGSEEREENSSWSVPRIAYCIEPSERAIMLFQRLLQLCVETFHKKDSSAANQHSTELEKMNAWCIVWSTLHVLRANLSQLLCELRTTLLVKSENGYRDHTADFLSKSFDSPSQKKNSSQISSNDVPDSPTTNIGPEVHSPKLNVSKGVEFLKTSTERRKQYRRRNQATFLRICSSFRGLHLLLLQLIDKPLKTKASILIAQGLDERTALLVSEKSGSVIVSEAAETIKIGFELFYPSATDCNSLLRRCMASSQKDPMNEVFLKAVMEKLAEEKSVVSLLEPLSDGISANRVDASEKMSTSPSSFETANSINSIDKLLADLLDHSQTHLFANLEALRKGGGNSSKMEASPYLKLLLAIQTHLCSHWIKRGQEQSGGDSMTCTVTDKFEMLPTELCLLVYGTRLLNCTAKSLNALTNLKAADSTTKLKAAQIFKVSFIAQLLPPFAASMCVVMPNSPLVMHLLLPLVKLMEVMNQCCLELGSSTSDTHKGEEKSESNSQVFKSSMILSGWLKSLFGLSSHLMGRLLATVIIAGPPTVKELALEKWLSSKIFAGGLRDTSSDSFSLGNQHDLSSTAALALLLDQSSELLGIKDASIESFFSNSNSVEKFSEPQKLFLQNLIDGNGDAHTLDKWMMSMFGSDSVVSNNNEMKAASLCQRSIAAVILAHSGLVTEALAAAATLKTLQNGNKGSPKDNHDKLEHSKLQTVWQVAICLERDIALSKQNKSSKEAKLIHQRAVQLALVANNNTSVKLLPLTDVEAQEILKKSRFLLRVCPVFIFSLDFQNKDMINFRSNSDQRGNHRASTVKSPSVKKHETFMNALWRVIHNYESEGYTPAIPEPKIVCGESHKLNGNQSHTPLTELLRFMSQSVDVDLLEMLLRRRCNRGKIRAFGIRLTRRVLSIISSKFGGIRAEVLTYLPDAFAQHSRMYNSPSIALSSKSFKQKQPIPKIGHYLDGLSGCGQIIHANVNKSFIMLFEDLTSFLEQSLRREMQPHNQQYGDLNSVKELQSALLRCWGFRVYSDDDHLRNDPRANTYTLNEAVDPSSRSSADVFGAGSLLLGDGFGSSENLWHLNNKLRSNFFLLLGRILSGSHEGLSPRGKSQIDKRRSDGNILMNWKSASTRTLHMTAWRVFHLLSLQVTVLGEEEKENRSSNKSISESISDAESKEKDDKPGGIDECEPIFKVLLTELQRVHKVLEKRATVESIVSRVAKTSSMQCLLPSVLSMSPLRPGGHVPDLPLRLRRKNNCFAVSLWIKLAPTSLTQDSSRYVVCMCTRPVNGSSFETDDNLVNSEVEICPAIFIKYEELAVAAGKKSGSHGEATFVPYVEMVVSSRIEGTYSGDARIRHNLARSARPLPVDRWVYIVATYTESSSQYVEAKEGKTTENSKPLINTTLELYFDGQRSASKSIEGRCIRQLGRPFHIGSPKQNKLSTFADAALACKKFDCKGSAHALVAGIAWHSSKINANAILDLCNMPAPDELAIKNFASDYCWRLCELLLSLVHTRVGVHIFINDHKWNHLLLDILRCASVRVQRCIIKILSIVLKKMNPSLISAPAVKVAVGTGRSAAAAGRGGVGLWQYLSNIIGVAWWCSLDDAESGVCGDVNSIVTQTLPEYLSPSLKIALSMANAKNEIFLPLSHPDGANNVSVRETGGESSPNIEVSASLQNSVAANRSASQETQSNNQMSATNRGSSVNVMPLYASKEINSNVELEGMFLGPQKSSQVDALERSILGSRFCLISDITSLLRKLLNDEKWKTCLADCIGKSLSRCYGAYREWIPLSRSLVDFQRNIKNSTFSRSYIGEVIAALCVLGGVSEQPHVGMKVRVPERLEDIAPIDFRGSVQEKFSDIQHTTANAKLEVGKSSAQFTKSLTGVIVSIDWEKHTAHVMIDQDPEGQRDDSGKSVRKEKNPKYLKVKQRHACSIPQRLILPISNVIPLHESMQLLLPIMGHARIAHPLSGICMLTLDPTISMEKLPPVAFSPMKTSPLKRAQSSAPLPSGELIHSPSANTNDKFSPNDEEENMSVFLERKSVWNQISSRALRAFGNILRLPAVAKFAAEQEGFVTALLQMATTDIAVAASGAISVMDQSKYDEFDGEDSIKSKFQNLQRDESLSSMQEGLSKIRKMDNTDKESSKSIGSGDENMDLLRVPRMASSLSSPAVMLSVRLATWLSVPSLERLNDLAWSRLHSAAAPLSTDQAIKHPRLERLGGIVKINQSTYQIHSASNFPSVKLASLYLCRNEKINNSPISTSAKPKDFPGCVSGGCWFYEVILLTDGLMQIGWADALYKGDPDRGQGVGDHPHSWAIDGYRCKKWNGSSDEYGERWRASDVVGCLLDLESMKMQFYLNGEDLGVAFSNFHESGGLYPAISLNMDQAARFNFGPPYSDFVYPPSFEYSSYRSVAEAFIMSKQAQQKTKPVVNSHTGKMESLNGSNGDITLSAITRSRMHSTDESKNQNDTLQIGSKSDQCSSLQQQEEAEAELQMQNDEIIRQAMIDNLISMGFPVEWCVRAASHHFREDLDESSTIAWIIEQMELEAARKSDQENEGEHAGNNGEEHDDDEDDDDEDDDEEDDDENHNDEEIDSNHSADQSEDLDDIEAGMGDCGDEEVAFLRSHYGNSEIQEHFDYLSSAIRQRMLNDAHDDNDSDDSDHTENAQDHSTSLRRLEQTDSSAISALSSEMQSSSAMPLHATTTVNRRWYGRGSDNVKRDSKSLSDDHRSSSILRGGISTRNVSDDYLLLMEEECDELYTPVSSRFFASTGMSSPTCANLESLNSVNSSVEGSKKSLPDEEAASADQWYESLSVMTLIESDSDTENEHLFIDRRPSSDVRSLSIVSSPKSSHTYSHRLYSLFRSSNFSGNALSDEPLHILSQTNDVQELWGLGNSSSLALLVVYARACLLSILQVNQYSGSQRNNLGLTPDNKNDEEEEDAPLVMGNSNSSDLEVQKSDAENSIYTICNLANILRRPDCLMMFLDFLKLVRFRGPLLFGGRVIPFVTDQKLQCFQDNAFQEAHDAMSNIVTPFLRILLDSSTLRDNKNYNKSIERDTTPLFVTMLLEESLSHMSRACARDYDRKMWLVSPGITDELRFTHKRISLMCDSDTLIQPNPLWAAWALNTLMDEFFGKRIDESDQKPSIYGSSHKDAELRDKLADKVFSVEVYSKLIDAAMTPNMALKEITFRLCARILSHTFQNIQLKSVQPSEQKIQKVRAYLISTHEFRLMQAFSSRIRKEGNSMDLTIHSSYLQCLSQLLVFSQRLRTLIQYESAQSNQSNMDSNSKSFVVSSAGSASTYNIVSRNLGQNGSKGLPSRKGLTTSTLSSSLLSASPEILRKNNYTGSQGIGTMPTLFLDDVTSTSITIGWWIDPDWVKNLADQDLNVEVQVEMAKIYFEASSAEDCRKKKLQHSESQRLEFKPLRLPITPVVEYVPHVAQNSHESKAKNIFSESRGRPRTISTMTSTDLDPDSRYVFRLTATTTQDERSNENKSRNIALKRRPQKDDSKTISATTGSNSHDEASATMSEKPKAIQVDDGERKKSSFSEDEDEPKANGVPTVSFGLISASAAASLAPVYRSNTLTAETLSEMMFMLDPAACGGNLIMSSGNLVVTNTVNKKWNAVRATASFSSGIHSWEVHIDKCVSKNIFVGVVAANASVENYVGSDRYGWGYLANKAIWHNKGKMRSYGELFRQGDTIGVKLDMEVGTLSFTRNGKDLGVAVEGLVGDMYPAFSLYNQDDQVSLVAGGRVTGRNRIDNAKDAIDSTAGDDFDNTDLKESAVGNSAELKTDNLPSNGSFSRRTLDKLDIALRTGKALSGMFMETPVDADVLAWCYDFFLRWREGYMLRYPTIDGDIKALDASPSACMHFGFPSQSCIRTTKGDVQVLGEAEGQLFLRRVRISAGKLKSTDASIAMQRTSSRIPPLAHAHLLKGTVAYPWSRKVIRELRVNQSISSLASTESSSSGKNISSHSNLFDRSNSVDVQTNSNLDEKRDPVNGNQEINRKDKLNHPYVQYLDSNTGCIPPTRVHEAAALRHWWFGACQVSVFAPKVDTELLRILNELSLESCVKINKETGIRTAGVSAGGALPGVWNVNPEELSVKINTDRRLKEAIASSEKYIAQVLEKIQRERNNDAEKMSHEGNCKDNDQNRQTASKGGDRNAFSEDSVLSIGYALSQHGISVLRKITPGVLKARAGILLFFNSVTEPVLPLIELWQDGTSFSASGSAPSVGNFAAIGGVAPSKWSLGNELIESRRHLFTATKWRLLCMFMARTATNRSSLNSQGKNTNSESSSNSGMGDKVSSTVKSKTSATHTSSSVLQGSQVQPKLDITLLGKDQYNSLTRTPMNTGQVSGGLQSLELKPSLSESKWSGGTKEQSPTSTLTPTTLRSHMATANNNNVPNMRKEFRSLLKASVFGQVVSSLHVIPPSMFRFGDGLAQSCALKVSFKMIDIEASYNDKFKANNSPLASPSSLSSEGVESQLHPDQMDRENQEQLFLHVAKELVWPLRMFDVVPQDCFNAEHASDNRNVLVPSEIHASSWQRSHLYRYVGKMIGIGLRTCTPFDLPLAPFIWKLLINPGVPLFFDDVAPLDEAGALQVLTDLELAKAHSLEIEETFRAYLGSKMPEKFTIDVEAGVRVRFRVLKDRLDRVRVALSEIRAGMLDVIPGHTLSLFTSQELKELVCEGVTSSRQDR